MVDKHSHRDLKPPRYTRRPFPPYAYTPGRDPHPTRDPDGHSYQSQPSELEPFDPTRWQDCEEYLYAIDLFNHGYYWEAHESFEAVWVAAGRKTRPGLFVQGLLQIGVGMLKQRQGQHHAAKGMWQSGLEKLHGINGPWMGIDTDALRVTVRQLLSDEITSLPPIKLAGLQ